MPRRARIFRLFVSSTFTDLVAERRALQENVFPRLHTLCRERGAQFQPVDLRWGISAEAAHDQQTVSICVQEVARCREVTPRPNFLVLLSERYGWRPPPPEIPAAQFRAIVDQLGAGCAAPGGGAWLSRWYRRDDNAVPVVYRLLPRAGEFAEYPQWAPVEAELVRALRTAAGELIAKGVLPPSARLHYGASATEQEIAAGIPEAPHPGPVLCVLRHVEGAAPPALATRYIDAEEDARDEVRRLKARLRSLLPPEDVLEYRAMWTSAGVTSDHLAAFREDVYTRLSKTIVEELETPRGDDIDDEREGHASFAAERSQIFVGRRSILDQLDSLVTSTSRSPFAVVGLSGSGKSALIAKAAADASARHQDTVIVKRFIGATPDSSEPRTLLQGVCREIARAYGAPEHVPDSYEELITAFGSRLGHASQSRPLIVFIDALDQLRGVTPTSRFPWLPTELPPYARVVLSALPEFHSALERVVPQDCILNLGAMAADEGSELLDRWLERAGRTLQPAQRAAVGARFARVPLPLFLRLLFEQVRHWRSDQEDFALSDTSEGVIQDLLTRLSAEQNHGRVLVSTALSLLAAARDGLAEDELLGVLGADAEVLADHRRRSPESPPIEGLPHIIWSRLRQDLAAYLSEQSADGAVLLSFFHRQMHEQVRASFLADHTRERRHADLARYFGKRPLYLDPAKRFPDLRKLSELPFQQAEAACWDELAETLLKYSFLEAKTRAMGPQPLLDDFDHALSRRRSLGITRDEWDDEVGRVGDALRLSAHVLQHAPDQLPGHLAGRLSTGPTSRIEPLLIAARAAPIAPWLRPVKASLREPGDALIRTLGGHAAVVHRISASRSGRYAVSAGNDGAAVVWDLESNSEVHRLLHEESVFDAGITADDRAVICAAGSKLTLWDLARGRLLRTQDPGVGWIRGLAVTGDGRAVFGSDDGVVGEWEIESDQVLLYENRISAVTAVALLGDREAATSTRSDISDVLPSWVVVWDLARRTRVRDWTVAGGVTNLAATMGGRTLLTAGRDGAVKVWDAESGTLEKTLQHHHWWVEGVAVTPDGLLAISGGVDHMINVWDLRSGNKLGTLHGHHNVIRALAIVPGDRFLSGSDDQTVRLWDLRRSRAPSRLSAHEAKVRGMDLAPDGRLLATGCDRGSVKLWSIETGELVTSLAEAGSGLGEIYDLKFVADGSKIVSVSNGAVVHVLNAETGEILIKLHLVPRSRPIVETIVLSPDAQHFFYGSELFELTTGKVAYVLPEYEAAVMAYLSDARRVVYVGNGRPMRLWDVEESRQVGALPNGAAAVAMLPGDSLVSVTYDSVVRVWDLEGLAFVKELRGHRGRIDAVAVAAVPGRRFAVTASGDHDVKLWDLDVGQEIASFSAEAPLWSCAISPDGRHAAAGDENGNVHFLAVERL